MTYRFVSDSALRAVQLGLLGEAIVRGANYLSTPDAASTLYTKVEQSAPLGVWGAVFIIFGVIGLLGELLMARSDTSALEWSHRAWPSFIAHVGLMSLFGAFAISAAFGVAARDPIYGYVSPYDMALFAVVHWSFARRRKHA